MRTDGCVTSLVTGIVEGLQPVSAGRPQPWVSAEGALTRLDDQALRELMVRYQRGDMEAFEGLYRHTLPMVRGYLSSMMRDRARVADLAQESYLQLHVSRRTYDPSRPVRPWLLGIVRHVRLCDYRVRCRRVPEVRSLDAAPPAAALPSELDHLADRDILVRALDELPVNRREVLVMHHLLGFSFREIAHVVGVSEGGARIRASRGIAQLREVLGKAGGR